MEWERELRGHPFELVCGTRGTVDRAQAEAKRTLHPIWKIEGKLAQRYIFVSAGVV
jgi:hypothetical protein